MGCLERQLSLFGVVTKDPLVLKSTKRPTTGAPPRASAEPTGVKRPWLVKVRALPVSRVVLVGCKPVVAQCHMRLERLHIDLAYPSKLSCQNRLRCEVQELHQCKVVGPLTC